jgi:pilus assembly protein CpaF
VTEIVGMEGDVVILQDLLVFDITGEDANGRVIGQHRFTGVRPAFWNQAKYFGFERELAEILETGER